MKKLLDINNLKDTGTEVLALGAGTAAGYSASKFMPEVSFLAGWKKNAALAGLFIVASPFVPKGFARTAIGGAAAINAVMAVSTFTSTSTLPGADLVAKAMPQINGVGNAYDETTLLGLGNVEETAMPSFEEATLVDGNELL